jgi:Nucleoside-diphosphate-sugar epimerases
VSVKALVAGGAGILGSNLSWLLLKKGYQVTVMDIVRREEAWRLADLEVLGDVNYVWKNVADITADDVKGYDLVIDCAIGYADRPMGISSPTSVMLGNLLPPLRLLEALRQADFKGYAIYPSSFNALYGHRTGAVFSEFTPPLPNNVYGWTKGAAELLYHSYRRQYGLRTLVTRVGSAFGPRGRSDELPHRLIIYGLLGKRFTLRSPYAKRVWTYAEDVIGFYDRLLERLDDVYESSVFTLHLVGNKGDEVTTNVELAKRVKKYVPSLDWVEGEYEPGEKDVDFTYDSTLTRTLLKWSPQFSLDEGIERTVAWFKENLWRYSA